MKNFVFNNWYRLAIAFSAVMFSSAFLIYSLKNNIVQASPRSKKEIAYPDKKAYDQIITSPSGKVYGVYYDGFRWNAEILTTAE